MQQGDANVRVETLVRRDLRLEDLDGLAHALRDAQRSSDIYQMIDALSAEVMGHRLLTIMRFDAGRDEVERVHTSRPDVYPIGGRKKKAQTAWADHVLRAMKVFRANDLTDIRAAFDDHQTIAGLGLGSILNVPIVFENRCLGTMNLCHQAGWYRRDDEQTGVLLGTFLVPCLLNGKLQ